MESCGSAHYWGRRIEGLGHRVVLLPPHQVKPYVRRNKTDRTDAKGILEASRSSAPGIAGSTSSSTQRPSLSSRTSLRRESNAQSPPGPHRSNVERSPSTRAPSRPPRAAARIIAEVLRRSLENTARLRQFNSLFLRLSDSRSSLHYVNVTALRLSTCIRKLTAM
jgi:hypothetical protein